MPINGMFARLYPLLTVYTYLVCGYFEKSSCNAVDHHRSILKGTFYA